MKWIVATMIAIYLGCQSSKAADPVKIIGNKKCSVCYVKKIKYKDGRMTIRMLGDRCFKSKPKGQCKLLKIKRKK